MFEGGLHMKKATCSGMCLRTSRVLVMGRVVWVTVVGAVSEDVTCRHFISSQYLWTLCVTVRLVGN
jgi:hypothetical protein